MADDGKTTLLGGAEDEPSPPLEVDPRYRILGEIARGGMGRILRAEDQKLGREVALKRLLDRHPEHRRRFANEARITARLAHPAIVPLHDAIDLDGPDPYYTMKLVAGRSLSDAIASLPTLAQRITLLPSVVAVADAVAHAHSRRIVHRDLKPANVLLGDFGETVVIDWGLAKHLDESEDKSDAAPTDVGTTSAGEVLGTPAFMPPEQAAGKPVDARADVYAIGAILYHTLTGAAPYEGSAPRDTLARIIAGPPPPVTQREPNTPRDLAAIVDKALAHDPSRRYRDAGDLAADLRRFTTGQLVGAFRYSRGALFRRWLRRHRVAVAVGSILGLALVITGLVSVQRIVRARHLAEARANDLRLAQARAVLARDPTASLAWLKTHEPTDASWSEARTTALEARSAGVAHAVLPTGVSGPIVAITDGHVGLGGADRLVVASWRERRLVVLARTQSRVTALEGAGGRWVAGTAGGDLYFSDGATPARRIHAHDSMVADIAIGPGGEAGTVGVGGEIRRWTSEGVALAARRVDGLGMCATFAGADLLVEAEGVVHPWGREPIPVGNDDLCAGLFGRPGGWLRVSSSAITTFREGSPRQTPVPDTRAVAVTPDRSVVVVGSETGRVTRLQVDTGELSVLGELGSTVTEVTISPDGLRVVAAAAGVVHVIDPDGTRMLRGHAEAIAELASVDDEVVSVSRDGEIRVWHVPPTETSRLGDAGDAVFALAWRDGDTLVTGSQRGVVTAWSRPSGAPTRIAGHGGLALIALTDPTAPIFSAGHDGALAVDGRVVGNLGAPVLALAASRDGSWVGGGGRNHRLLLVRVADGTTRTITSPSEVTALSFAPSRPLVVYSGEAPAIVALDLEGSGNSRLEGHTDMVLRLVWGPDGRTLASGGNDRTVRLWDLDTGRGTTLPHVAPVLDVAFLDGERVITSTRDGSVRVWRGGEEERDLRGHTGWVFDVAVAAGGRFVASAGADGTTRLWDLESGGTSVLRGHQGRVKRVAFSPDGRTLASGGEDGRVRLWPVEVPTVPRERFHAWLDDATTAVLGANGRVATTLSEAD